MTSELLYGYTRYKHGCTHDDCMYSGARKGCPWGCDYATITKHSRVAWHRERGLSERPKDCRLYTKGKRVQRKFQAQRDTEHEKRLRLYREGKNDGEIAAELGVGYQVINKWRRSNKLSDQREVRKKKQEELYVILHDAGWSIRDCAKILHVGENKIKQFQAELGLPCLPYRPTAEMCRHREEVLQQLRDSGKII